MNKVFSLSLVAFLIILCSQTVYGQGGESKTLATMGSSVFMNSTFVTHDYDEIRPCKVSYTYQNYGKVTTFLQADSQITTPGLIIRCSIIKPGDFKIQVFSE